MSAREQRVRMARLWRPGTRSRSVGQRVAVEARHLLEMGLDRLRRRQPRHTGADDDGLLEDWVAHFGYLQGEARLTPFWPRFQPRQRGVSATRRDDQEAAENANLRFAGRQTRQLCAVNLSRLSARRCDEGHTAGRGAQGRG